MNKGTFIKIFLTANCLLLSIQTFSQRQILGRVVEELTNKPIKEAYVTVEGKNINTTTNHLGYFQLTIDSLDVLHIASNEYESLSFNSPSQDRFKVELKKKEISIYADGMDSFYVFLSQTLRYPSKALASNRYGTVYTSFQIDETGNLHNINLINDIGQGCGNEVLRGLTQLPSKFIPENPNAVYILPVRFRMDHIRNEKVNPVEIPEGIMLKEVELLVMGIERVSF